MFPDHHRGYHAFDERFAGSPCAFIDHHRRRQTMVASCVLAVSGTPGTGKTSLCEALSAAGWQVLSLSDLADEHGCKGPVDEADGAAPIDVHRLAETWEPPQDGCYVVDGHLAHLMDVDGIVLLRCNPEALNKRLSARGYDARKAKANVEWEMTAGHWAELMEFEIELPLLELDTTKQDDGAVGRVQAWVDAGLPGLPLTEQAMDAIDWLGE